MDVEQFVRNGYVPYVDDPGFVAHSGGATFSVSHTLEYGFSAYATAQLAKQLGHEEDYRQLMDLSDGWAKVFKGFTSVEEVVRVTEDADG